MTKETYSKIHFLIIKFGDARFMKGVAPLDSDWEKNSIAESNEIFKEISEILLKEID